MFLMTFNKIQDIFWFHWSCCSVSFFLKKSCWLTIWHQICGPIKCSTNNTTVFLIFLICLTFSPRHALNLYHCLLQGHTHAPETRGLCLSEEQTITTVCTMSISRSFELLLIHQLIHHQFSQLVQGSTYLKVEVAEVSLCCSAFNLNRPYDIELVSITGLG